MDARIAVRLGRVLRVVVDVRRRLSLVGQSISLESVDRVATMSRRL